MSTISMAAMRGYLSQSITNLNQNKLRGLLAEVDLRTHLLNLGFAGRVSSGGWIARTKGPGIFGHSTIALFPEVLNPSMAYPTLRPQDPARRARRLPRRLAEHDDVLGGAEHEGLFVRWHHRAQILRRDRDLLRRHVRRAQAALIRRVRRILLLAAKERPAADEPAPTFL